MNSDTKLQAEQRMKNTNEHILVWNTQKVFSLWIISLFIPRCLSQMRSDAFFKGAENWKKCAQISVASSL